MSDLRTAAQQALEALEYAHKDGFWREQSNAITALKAALEQPGQEPVARVRVFTTGGNAVGAWKAVPVNDYESLPPMRDGELLYTAPPRREWRGLTEEEFWPMLEAEGRADRKPVEIIAALARAIEAALKERNA